MISSKNHLFGLKLVVIIYLCIYSVITWLTNHLIFTDSYFYTVWGSQLSTESIEKMIERSKNYEIIGYLILYTIVVLKWSILTCIIYTGVFLFNQTVSFRNCCKIVLIAELAPLSGAIAKSLFFCIHRPENLLDMQYFYPLSLLNFLNTGQLPVYLIYPLQQFNLFEAAYWLLIANGIKVHTQKSLESSLKVVAASYGVGLFIWVLFIVFVQLQFS